MDESRDQTLSYSGSVPNPRFDRKKKFPEKLWHAINDATSDLLTWRNDGRAFMVDSHRFELEIFETHPNLVQVRRFSNFCRQLSVYGFERQHDARFHLYTFEHPSFSREEPPNKSQNQGRLFMATKAASRKIQKKYDWSKKGRSVENFKERLPSTLIHHKVGNLNAPISQSPPMSPPCYCSVCTISDPSRLLSLSLMSGGNKVPSVYYPEPSVPSKCCLPSSSPLPSEEISPFSMGLYSDMSYYSGSYNSSLAFTEDRNQLISTPSLWPSMSTPTPFSSAARDHLPVDTPLYFSNASMHDLRESSLFSKPGLGKMDFLSDDCSPTYRVLQPLEPLSQPTAPKLPTLSDCSNYMETNAQMTPSPVSQDDCPQSSSP